MSEYAELTNVISWRGEVFFDPWAFTGFYRLRVLGFKIRFKTWEVPLMPYGNAERW